MEYGMMLFVAIIGYKKLMSQDYGKVNRKLKKQKAKLKWESKVITNYINSQSHLISP